MIKDRILWLLWLVCMAGAAVITGTWLFAAVLLLTVLILIFSAGSVVLSGKKAVIKLHLPKASERMECFHGKMYLENQSAWPVFGGAGVLRWENLFTGEKGVIPISFSLGGKEKQVIGFEAGSNWCGCIRFCFSDWKCQDFFRVFSLKRKADTCAYTVVMPERQKGELSLFTREGFDMESFRYSGSRPGDDPGETYDIREYRSGDSIRQIHWKLTGKLDKMMIRQRSFPVDDTVLILAEPYLKEKAPAVAQTLGEVFAAVLNSFMEQGISCQAGVFDHSTGHFYIEKIRTREDYETILYLFLRHGGEGEKPCTITEYLHTPGQQRFANYIYITGAPEEEDLRRLRTRGEVTVVSCGTTADKGETITWKYGSQDKKKNIEDTCPVSCWKVS